MKHFTKIYFSAAAIALVMAAVALPAQVRATTFNGTCQTISLPVALSAGAPMNNTLAGTFCQPNTWAAGPHKVDMLLHGGTYNSSYWDFPVSSPDYSYVDKTMQAGRATFAIDQIGTGTSSKPLSATVTIDATAYVLHQAVQWLRTTQGFTTVNLISHSVGSFTAIREAGLYNDVDSLVVTGAIHSPGVGQSLLTGSLGLYPAALDPQFFGQGYDLGYVTTASGTRSSIFYGPNADPQVVAYDVAHKDILSSVQTVGALADLATPPLLNISNNITVPVLVLMGEQDTLFCGLLVACSQTALTANEAPYYAAASSFSAQAVPATGHNLALHPSTNESFSTINQWIQAH
jgi:pimeloyl-ACP methyl ester carboxylesterase